MRDILRIAKALSDETRLNIIELLVDGEQCVCDISTRVHRTQPTVSTQLAKLEHLGIVKSRRDGRRVCYHLADPRVAKVIQFISQ